VPENFQQVMFGGTINAMRLLTVISLEHPDKVQSAMACVLVIQLRWSADLWRLATMLNAYTTRLSLDRWRR